MTRWVPTVLWMPEPGESYRTRREADARSIATPPICIQGPGPVVREALREYAQHSGWQVTS